jgi:Flp pilus assembly protein TadG
MLETSLFLLPFFIIFFAIIDYAQIYFYDNALQNALRESARFATAGRIIPPLTGPLYETNQGVVMARALNDSSGREASRCACIRYWFLSNCVIKNIVVTNAVSIYSASAVGLEMPEVTTNNGVLQLVAGMQTNASGTVTNTVPATPGPGGAGDYVQITATYHINTITPIPGWLGGFTGRGFSTGYWPARVSAIVKNEPALLNFEHTNIYSDEASNMVEQ